MSSKTGHVDEKKGESSSQLSKNKKAKTTTGVVQETLFAIFFVRLVNSYCVRTFFQPDEYFQALEPAWQMIYGDNSGAWITWEWRHALRSTIHPAIFAFGYFIVDSFWSTYNVPVAKAKWLLMAPKMLQTGLAALSDWYTWRLAGKLYGSSSAAAWATLLITLLNPWQWYTSTRTFSNCFETTLTAMALYYLPWELLGAEARKEEDPKNCPPALLNTRGQVNSLRLSFLLAAFAVLLRPTNAFVWLAVGTLTVTRFTLSGQSPLTQRVVLIILREIVLCGSLALGVSLLIDGHYFEEWTFPPFTWLHINVKLDIAKFYGQNDWHYFLSQGIPLLSTTITPFVLQGLKKSLDAESVYPMTTANALKALSFIVITSISTLSFVSHKEVRFIQPLLPALHIIAAPYVTSYFTTLSTVAAGVTPVPAFTWRKKSVLACALLVNVVIGGYLSWFHAAGPIQVMSFLRSEFERIHPNHLAIPRNTTISIDELRPDQELFALFLTPCHATPWRSHLVYPGLHARALSCEPPLHTAPNSPERAAYQDETRWFYADPVKFMAQSLWPGDVPGADMARYIIAYEPLTPYLQEYFAPDGPGKRHKIRLTETWSAWNGLFTDDERKSGRLIVWDTGFYN
ncbi:glycosyltransferase family 22 protein [Xylariaceae sp. FL0255]|nr:glycosyltransferase family 22 protein [Xylariaceae sp. FL0255]